MSLIKDNENYLLDIIHKLGYQLDNVELLESNRQELGEWQVNCAFNLGKENHENPRNVAEKIVNELDNRFINVNIAGPGFINLSFNPDYLIEYFNNYSSFDELIEKKDHKKVIVDYGGANAAKALHVGHMRSANIGEAIRRLLVRLGYEVIGDVHLGDLGRQSGMLISEYKRMVPDSPFFDPNFKGEYPKINLTAKDLGEMYPRANIAAQNDPDRMDEVREITALIDKGNVPYTTLWKQMVDISRVEIKKVYDRLNCHFDLWEGELDSFKYIPNVLEIMKDYLYESEGALVCDVESGDNKPMPPLMVIKKDGASIYGTRDLGTIYSRITRFNPDEIWYFTDDRQSLYFEQVFRASYKTHLVDEKVKLKHFPFGTINGSDGKPFKTRDGGVMELNNLIDLIYQEVEKKIKDEITGDERKDIAEKLTIAALKYSDLLPFRKTDYNFDPVKFSSLDGKTGPYILYTIVRMKSLLKKNDLTKFSLKVIPNKEVKDILTKLLTLNNVIDKTLTDASLNYICEYLFDLLSLYNKFYNNYNILNEKDLLVKESYLSLTSIVYEISKELLNILAIDEVEKM